MGPGDSRKPCRKNDPVLYQSLPQKGVAAMRYLLAAVIMTICFAPAGVPAAKDQDDIDNREVVDKDFQKAAKDADKYLKQIEDAVEDMEKELKSMKKDVQESIKQVKLVAKLAKKKRINLKKINNEWDDVIDDHKRIEKALDEIEDIHTGMEKSYKSYDKAIIKIAK
jgi:septal ring factor EnvC (AmiA/AmiB activator)